MFYRQSYTTETGTVFSTHVESIPFFFVSGFSAFFNAEDISDMAGYCNHIYFDTRVAEMCWCLSGKCSLQ